MALGFELFFKQGRSFKQVLFLAKYLEAFAWCLFFMSRYGYVPTWKTWEPGADGSAGDAHQSFYPDHDPW